MALIGEKIEYSLSPRIFEAILDQLGLDGSFDLVSVSAAQLPESVRRLKDKSCCGFAVTIPYKVTVIEHLDELDNTAQQIGAVNSVAIADGRLVGHNTDSHGFTFGLERAGIAEMASPVLVIGSGGGARAVVQALSESYGVNECVVLARPSERLEHLKNHIKNAALACDIQFVTDSSNLPCKPRTVINCTALGGANHPELSPLPEDFDWTGVNLYYDLNYNKNNIVLELAANYGARVVEGSAMLVAQAIKSFELWTGYRADFEPVYQTVFAGRLS